LETTLKVSENREIPAVGRIILELLKYACNAINHISKLHELMLDDILNNMKNG
jgi:hypothetical protein